MALLLSQQLQRFLSTKLLHLSTTTTSSPSKPPAAVTAAASGSGSCHRVCSAIAIDAPSSSVTDVEGVRWGYASLQGPRDEMEDDVILRSDGLDGFSFAAVFDGHAGSASVKFLREELYKECVRGLQGGLLLSGGDFLLVKEALREAFEIVDKKLLDWLEASDAEDESGSTATVMFIGDSTLFVSHIGDSCVVLCRSGEAEELTNSHRPFGSNKASLEEIRRIREAGGWIVNGRICGDIAVSRAFGDIRFKRRKIEMLKKGVEEGRWTEKFVSRVQFKEDLIIASPDVFQVPLISDVEFVILASDGLWDYINSSEAVNFVRNQLRQHGDTQLACEALAGAALDRRSQDNVSIIIADLGRTDWQNLPVQQQNIVVELVQALATVGIVSVGIWMSSFLSF